MGMGMGIGMVLPWSRCRCRCRRDPAIRYVRDPLHAFANSQCFTKLVGLCEILPIPTEAIVAVSIATAAEA